MTDIQDLDVVAPPPKRVRFGGVEYDIPADIPMEIFLRINQANQIKDDEGNPDQIKQLEAVGSVLTDLFVWEIEDRVTPEQRDEIRTTVNRELRRRGVRFSFGLISTIYRDEEEPEKDPEDPTQALPQPAEDSNGTKSSSISPSLETSPTQPEPASSA